MKKLLILSGIIILTLKSYSQLYIDIKQLADAGIDISTYPPGDLLYLGIGNCDLELVKSAIAKGADLNRQFEPGLGGIAIWPLCKVISAASDAMLPAEESIIANQISDGGTEVFSGRSVTELRHDYIEILRFLLQKGAKATVSPDFNSDNIPLLLAADYRDIEIIKLLSDFKADPNSRDQMGNTSLHRLGLTTYPSSLPYKNAPDIAKLLISKGAKMVPNNNDDTPLELAKSSLKIIQSEEAAYWRDFLFYDELVKSLNNLIDIYSRM